MGGCRGELVVSHDTVFVLSQAYDFVCVLHCTVLCAMTIVVVRCVVRRPWCALKTMPKLACH